MKGAGHSGFCDDSHVTPLNVVPVGQDAFRVEIQALPSKDVPGGHEGCWTETQTTPLKINPLGQSGGCSVIQTVPFSLVPGGQISVPGKTHSFPLKLVPAGQHFTSLDPLSWDGNISFRVMLRLSSAGVDSAAAALRFPIAMGSNPLSTPRIPGPTLLLSAAA